MSPYTLPLSAGDLIAIGKALEPIEDAEALVANPVIGRIEVLRPDGDEVVGHFQSAGFDAPDDWYGFVPVAP